MSEQLLARLTEWGTAGEAPESPSVGLPLQEQVELVEQALSDALAVIEALAQERQERANDVYQAQVDAQDWCNKYQGLQREVHTLRDERDTWKVKCQLAGRACDKEQIRELTNEIAGWRAMYGGVAERVEELTRENTDLELRYEMQSDRAQRLYERTRRMEAAVVEAFNTVSANAAGQHDKF